MASLQTLRVLVNERLNVAAEEIFGVFTKTITQYEEEIHRQREMLKLVFKPEIKSLNAADAPQHSFCLKEVPSEQQERSSSLDQEETSTSLDQEETSTSLDQEEPEPPQVKEEQEELRTSQRGGHLRGQEEADIIKFTFIPVPVKREPYEEKPQSSWFNQTQGEESREAEPLASILTEQIETEDDGVSDHASGLNPQTSKTKGKGQSLSVHNQLVYRSTESYHELESSFRDPSRPCCKVCGKSFPNKVSLNRHVRVHPSDCGLCGKHLESEESLKLHRETHSTCRVCGKIFPCIANLERHMRTHTGEKLFSCTVCGKGFSQKAVLKTHMMSHTGEKPFFCALCGKRFRQKEALKKHMITHTGEKIFRCTVCGKQFSRKAVLVRHLKAHTGEKPFGCLVCGETFRRKDHMQSHMLIHTGEKPYTCSVCGQSFRHLTTFNRHKCQSGEWASELLLLGLGDSEHQTREWTSELPLTGLGDEFAMVSDIDGY